MGQVQKDKEDLQLTEEEMAAKAEAEAETDEEQKIYKKRRWQHKLKLGTHYRMERFTIMFGLVMTMLVLFGFSGWNSSRIAQNELVGTQAKYTQNFEFSLSKVPGSVEGVYRDPDGKRAYVLLHMPDVSNLSLDAKNYEMFLTGFNKQLDQEPAASLFMFGSSGYVGLEFYDERGLANEIFQITLRNNSEITNAVELTEQELANLYDPSFGENDQAEIFVNVGADEVTTMDVLSQKLEPVQLYYALIGRTSEELIFDSIASKTETLGQLMAQHNEHTNRLVSLGYKAPPKPEYMDGDYIDEDGHFRPRTYVKGSHDIEYIGRNSTDGFVSQVVDDVSNFRKYMADKRAAEQLAGSTRDSAEEPPRLESMIRDDGYEIFFMDITQNEATDNELRAKDATEALMVTWTQYIQVKKDLQITSMRELLLLDANIRTQGNAFSVHSGDDFLIIW